ncbi:hypothetical protein GCM10027168_01950 [Streptomyces capparidis]
MAGKHRRNRLCNHCGKTAGAPSTKFPGKQVSLLVDLEEYADEERIFQAPRSADNPLPLFLVWCTDCATEMIEAGDPIVDYQEIGFPKGSLDGPYAQILKRFGKGLDQRWR